MSDMPTPAEVDALVNEIRPLLAGKGPLLQGAALADLVAMFIAGHRGRDAAETAMRQMEIMVLHIETVGNLIPVNEKLLMGEL